MTMSKRILKDNSVYGLGIYHSNILQYDLITLPCGRDPNEFWRPYRNFWVFGHRDMVFV